MLPTVTYQDVMSRYLEGDAAELGETKMVEALIADVVDDIQVRFGATVEARLKSGAITNRSFSRVVANVTLRVLRNPEGIYREQLGTYQYHQSRQVATGYITYMPDDLAVLTGGPMSSIGTIDMNVSTLGGGTIW